MADIPLRVKILAYLIELLRERKQIEKEIVACKYIIDREVKRASKIANRTHPVAQERRSALSG